MPQLLAKLKLIYLPFLLVGIGFIGGYSFLMWLIVYRFEILSLNEELIKFWLPFCLPAIPVFIWVRPKIKLLVLRDKKGNLPFLYFFAASLAISAPTIIAQEYLLTATGELTTINSIDEITRQPFTKYYVIRNHYIDKQHATVHRRTEVSGKNNEHLTFHLYVACPIINNIPTAKAETLTRFKTPVAWLGTEYMKGISNNSSDAEKEAAFKELGVETYNDLQKKNLDQFIYLDRIGNNDRRKRYEAAIKTSIGNNTSNIIILEAKTEPFAARNGCKLGWIFKSFAIGAGIWLLMLIFPKFNTAQLKKLPEYSPKNQFFAFSNFLFSIKIDKNIPLFVVIIALNILVFVLMVFAGLGFISFDGQDLYAWGANYRPAVVKGQWWRLLTSIFLHGGLMHLLFNMYGLLFVSAFLEPVLGKAKFIIAYILCGLLASLASIWWHRATLSVGASGAIFGLFGLMTALLTTNKVDARSKKALLINNAVFIGINLIIGLAGGIDNAAHIGGLLTGVIIGYIMYFFIEAPKPKRRYRKRSKSIDEEEKLVEKQPE
ncbi:rhomboid family intramembrane serine protease [Mucilaginibacter sp. RS28]|uniref:Rhomboid family intramembrane serine protease n=1 Tax=Mucilaginibacter straminoryzae TaxID=2932774 RepID=A0A9X2B852_9SPHI|nr:rhomboid family intramembrane serine protease [Mucilaginibacter straminoryzae]MCJ8209101.1 rhomboid family intramembrane serine protease [Mucilaginibacter straminoryzae]